MTSKEESTPERWAFKELKIIFPYTNICQRKGKIAKAKAPQHCMQPTWAELPLDTHFPNPSRKRRACSAAGTPSNFLLHVASFPCLGKCFWYEKTCGFRPQSFHFAGEMLESSEWPESKQGPPQLSECHEPLSLNLFSTPQFSADDVWAGRVQCHQGLLSVPA